MGGVSSHAATDALKQRERELILRRNLPPLVVEYIALQEARRERTPGRRLRALFRPIGRVLRGASRRVRGLPVEE
jgi:hypothetical protein